MSHQIIKQPDNRYCIFDTVSDTLVHINLSLEEITQVFVESYTNMIADEVKRIVKLIDEKESPYKHQTVTYAEALLYHTTNRTLEPNDKENQHFEMAFKALLEEAKKWLPKDMEQAAEKILPQNESFRGESQSLSHKDIPNGTRVKTDIHPSTESKDWTESAKRNRKSGATGVVVAYHDSHGLCYDVKHDEDKLVGCYDPWEIEVL